MKFMICQGVGAMLWLALAGVTGCATLRFQVVDGNTGRPLENVECTRFRSRQLNLAAAIIGAYTDPSGSAESGKDGVVVHAAVQSGQPGHSFVFKKPGYLDAEAYWPGGDEVGVVVPPSDPQYERRRRHDGAGERYVSASGVVVVAMFPVGTQPAPYHPVWTPVAVVPPEIVVEAEEDSNSYVMVMGKDARANEPAGWHNYPGALHGFKNQYGDYRVLWITPDGSGVRWEWVELIAREEQYDWGRDEQHRDRTFHADHGVKLHATTAPSPEELFRNSN